MFKKQSPLGLANSFRKKNVFLASGLALFLFYLLSSTTTATAINELEASLSPADQDFHLERVTWVGTVTKGGVVEVTNLFGDIRARYGGYEGQVEVLANIQNFAKDMPPLEMRGSGLDEGVQIQVGYQLGEDEDWVTRGEAGQRKRADLTVFVPQGATLHAKTWDGLLQIRGTQGDVVGRTENGEISLRGVDGNLDLSSRGGSIMLYVDKPQEERGHNITTDTGDIQVVLNEEAHLTARVETRGLISTDFSMTIEDGPHGPPSKIGKAVLGKGLGSLQLKSTNGWVKLVRRPLAWKARDNDGT